MITARAAIALHTETTGAPRKSFVHLLPSGTFTGLDGRGPYVAADPEADDAAILAAIRALVEKPEEAAQAARPDPTKWVPIGDFQRAVAEVNKMRRGVSLQAAQERVGEDIRAARILPWMKDWAVELGASNLPAYDKFMAGVGPGFSHLLGRVITGAPPESHSEGASDDTTRAVARNLGLSEVDIAAALRG